MMIVYTRVWIQSLDSIVLSVPVGLAGRRQGCRGASPFSS